MLEAAHLWLVCRDGAVQFSCSSVQLRSHFQRFATGPARFSSVLARSVNAVLVQTEASQILNSAETPNVDFKHPFSNNLLWNLNWTEFN